MSSHPIITGATGFAPGDPPTRLPIRQLISKPQMFSLYVQAVQAMSSTDQADLLSHFQIAGIHGLPFIQWGESGGSSAVPGSSWGGYCTHGSVLFPTWHRPYLALYEQVLQAHAMIIAKQYTTNQDQWLAAARDLRLPYWDWASATVPPDQVLMNRNISILAAPTGTAKTVVNPLYAYRFHPIEPTFYAPFSVWNQTMRNPSSQDANAQSQPEWIQYILGLLQGSDTFKDQAYRMLTTLDNWDNFSNHTAGPFQPKAASSLEAIHDQIHNLAGFNGGHMSDPSVAGFDPIFYMHHANVDRMLSLWQALHPEVWVTPNEAQDGGSFTMADHSSIDQETELTPFWNDITTYWNSALVRDWRTLGYNYPEFVGLDMSDAAAVQSAIGKIVNTLYGDPARMGWSLAAVGTGQVKEDPETLASSADKTMAAPAAAQRIFSSPGEPTVEAAEGEHKFNDWIAHIRCKKYEVGGSFNVYIFVGAVPDEPKEWIASPSFVGLHSAFVNTAIESCSNCRSREHDMIEGFVPLNRVISRQSGTMVFDSKTIEPYLKENLQWRVQKVSGEVVDIANIPSLQVVVTAIPLSFGETDIFPRMGRPRVFEGITHGLPGGHRVAA